MFTSTERAFEQERVAKIAAVIQQELLENQQKQLSAKQETRRIELSYGETAKINTIEIDDRMETNAAVQQQKQLVTLSVENQLILDKRQHNLKQLEKSPYFGRIDITDEDGPETLYIGTATLMTADDDDFLIYDWRSPIASVYYNGVLGSATYFAPIGKRQVNLQRKRQFTINKNQIVNMFDTNEMIGDEVLQQVLGQSASHYLQNIVATIQQEQNEIIRNTRAEVMVVQGVAGSGKTSTILQRIAYLLYHSRQELNSEQIILFSPNHLFSHYISQVLPSLGEKNMRQVTLSEFFSNRLPGLHVEDRFTRYERDQDLLPENTQRLRRYLESQQIIADLQDYLARPDFVPQFRDLVLKGQVIISQAEISTSYNQLSKSFKISDRFHQTKNKLIRLLQAKVKKLANSEAVQFEVENLSELAYQTLIGDEEFPDANEEADFLCRTIARQHYEPIYDAIYNDYFLDWETQYNHFLSGVIFPAVLEQAWQERTASVSDYFEKHQIRLSDCVPILYLRDAITGGGQNRQMQHLFIDEMQDYSAAQLGYIQHAFPKAKLTLLGDRAQDLFANQTWSSNFEDSIKQLFPKKKTAVFQLNNSYRSTQQITHFSSALLADPTTVLAFSRPGPLPSIISCERLLDLNQQVGRECTRLLLKQKMVAILTKTRIDAEQIYATLQLDVPVTLMTERQNHLQAGVMIMPIYLAKGLEFDAVIGYNVSAKLFKSSNDSQILYTIASRAMHELVLISLGQPSPLITRLPANLYQMVSKNK